MRDGQIDAFGDNVSMESRERPVATRTASPPTDLRPDNRGSEDGNIGSGDAGLSVPSLTEAQAQATRNLATMFESRKDDLDLAIMRVIAEGGSPSEWIAGLLRKSLPPEQAQRPRFLGE